MADIRTDQRSEQVQQAVDTASAAHRNQFRKGGETVPYLVHPLRVGELLAKAGCESDVIVAGILHDVLEDTSVTEAEIEESFGPAVLALVMGASEPDKQASWEERKQHTLTYLKEAPVEVLLVACADKLDNLGGLALDMDLHGERVWERFNRGRLSQQWYFEGLRDVFVSRGAESAPLAALADRFAAVCSRVFGS